MPGGNKGSSGKGGKSGKARSVGAAATGNNPSGAILDDTDEILSDRSQRFRAWAKGYRHKHLKPNPKLVMLYSKSPSPDGCKD